MPAALQQQSKQGEALLTQLALPRFAAGVPFHAVARPGFFDVLIVVSKAGDNSRVSLHQEHACADSNEQKRRELRIRTSIVAGSVWKTLDQCMSDAGFWQAKQRPQMGVREHAESSGLISMHDGLYVITGANTAHERTLYSMGAQLTESENLMLACFEAVMRDSGLIQDPLWMNPH